ncbi:hypothetical protein THRCLA_11752 [Thraustotheca clavata]|uniref:RING-type E3 ubiquitin transferase n=1 Tax=Thraustotheca clavata TaxID=74557 RepID=A0A1V9Y6U2_9STRA|nr:hypothetical protein THRCLA_11752 [Thraustotheca clavata]
MDFECNICLDRVKEPVVTLCGHLYCWPCLFQWISEHNECPVCKAGVTKENVVPVYGRGANSIDPRVSQALDGIPNRPRGQRPEPTIRRRAPQQEPDALMGQQGQEAAFSPMIGFFPSLFGLQFVRQYNATMNMPLGHTGPVPLTPAEIRQQVQFAFLSKMLLLIGTINKMTDDGNMHNKLHGLTASEQVAIVDEHNQVIGKADRSVMRVYNLPHRATYIVIRNSKGEFYVQRRTLIKDYCPGFLDPMAGGVVQFGESFQENAQREAAEEMGIVNTPLTYITTFFYKDGRSAVWGGMFECVYDGQLTLQPEEVSEVLLMSGEEILARKDEFTPDGIHALEIYLNHKK